MTPEPTPTPTITPTPTPVPTSTPIPTPTATPKPTPTPITRLGSIERPVPVGWPRIVRWSNDVWEVTLIDRFPNAWPQIIAKNSYNDPPAHGTQFYMVTLDLKNIGPNKIHFSDRSLRTVGAAVGWLYTPYGDSCGVIPNSHYWDVLPTFEAELNVCWQVASKDLPTLTMFWEGKEILGEEEVWFSWAAIPTQLRLCNPRPCQPWCHV